MPYPLSCQINGEPQTAGISPGLSLLSFLRGCGWAGVHRVCESGDCGSCTVWLDGVPVHSCILPALKAEGKAIVTIEGLSPDGKLTPMQQAFLERQGFQCGYCSPGMVMTASKLTWESEADLRKALDGNICRCTGYEAIVQSILAGKALEDGNALEPSPPPTEMPADAPQVGQDIPKQDGPDLVTGKPVYTADWAPPGLLHLKVLRSPHAHARIRAIDTTAALALPGVQAVFTHRDVPRRPFSTAGHGEPVPDPHDRYLLDNKVRFVGDRVAAVVAESVAIAERACQQIRVEYEVLPSVLSPAAAMGERLQEMSAFAAQAGSDAPVIHDEPESRQIFDAQHNISGQVLLEKGDVETGFSQADRIFERTYTLPAVQHFHLEPHVSTTWLDADGTLVVRSSTQVPFHCQRLLSELLAFPKEKIRVYKPQLGGGFGNKQEILSEDLCALATLRTGQPVCWEFTRKEEFTATNSRHAMQIHLKIGVKADGTLTAMAMQALANAGAYGNHSEQVIALTGMFSLGMYRCAHQRYLGRSAYTNTMPAGAFRGYGATQGIFALESLLDEIARILKLDPIALRQQQAISPADEILLGREEHFHVVGSSGLDAAIAQVRQALHYQSGTPPQVDGRKRRGVGFALSMQASGLAKIHLATVRMTLKLDGRYEMRSGSVDVGTGSNTTLRQIAADVLGSTVGQIDLIAADTRETPFDAGSYASATLTISGQAARLAAESLRSHLLEIAAGYLDCTPGDLRLSGDRVIAAGTALALVDLAQKASGNCQSLSVEEAYTSDRASLTFAILGAEVEVDTETGRVRVLRCVQAMDIGKAINPRICRGQATGGLAMGIGYALQEELRFDDRGVILNPTPRTYRLPLAQEVPPMEIILVEQPDPYGPCGAKGIGEIGTNCAAPAIANAIAHATGVRLHQLPMTPERVWRALQSPS